MNMLLKGKTALITGASKGIGAATAKLFAEHGAKVAINYNSSESAAGKTVSEIKAKGGEATKFKADVTDKIQVEKMISDIDCTYGKIDILVLNAGMHVHVAPFINYSWEDLEKKLVGEMKAFFYCTKAVVPKMIESKSGIIVAVSSGLSRRASLGFSAHSAAKSAIDAYAKSLAEELGPNGIRVNVVAPGLTLTDATAFMPDENKERMAALTPLKRNATPEDIAGGILILASDYAKFITGNYLPINGGNQML